MKLRIRGDSVRLRLARGEVQALVQSGAVRERTRVPGGAAFGYELRSDPAAAAVAASFDGGVLAVTVPAAAAVAWAGSQEVAIRAELPLAGGALAVLIEKDYPCLTVRAGEDDSDAFARDRLAVAD
ncbi:MAG: hypothetical protein JSR54_07190 [Proteobacteria bacterium]|nr:hypothetical protein [Pseudomonadota bacterium]